MVKYNDEGNFVLLFILQKKIHHFFYGMDVKMKDGLSISYNCYLLFLLY